jgi:coniferyl-aldehyde dehydrogenase
MPPPMKDPSTTQLQRQLENQRRAFRAQPMPPASRREIHLKRLAAALKSYRHELAAAVDADFNGRSRDETILGELFPSLEGVRHAIHHVHRWMRAESRRVGLIFQPARARVIYQPVGVVGVIAPWNYPVYLTIGPLTAALAAGNRVMIKASEFTPITANVLRKMLAGTFAEDHVCLVNGGADVAAAFSQLAFDHLFFTGSTTVGRHVMRAAADNLTPVTLELGGKSPALLAPDYPVDRTAGRIAFGKCFNAGQTCIAPDYLLCPENRVDDFVDAFAGAVGRLYPTMAGNPDYTAIVNRRHLRRLRGYLEDARAKGARLIEINPARERFDGTGKMPLWLVRDPDDAMAVMQDEIFGPILPIVPYRRMFQAVDYIDNRPRPLAMYVFDNDRRRTRTILDRTRIWCRKSCRRHPPVPGRI